MTNQKAKLQIWMQVTTTSTTTTTTTIVCITLYMDVSYFIDLEHDDTMESLDVIDEIERPFTSLINLNAPISLQVDGMRP